MLQYGLTRNYISGGSVGGLLLAGCYVISGEAMNGLREIKVTPLFYCVYICRGEMTCVKSPNFCHFALYGLIQRYLWIILHISTDTEIECSNLELRQMFHFSVIIMINEYIIDITGSTIFSKFHSVNSLSVALNVIFSDNITCYNKLNNMVQWQWNITVPSC